MKGPFDDGLTPEAVRNYLTNNYFGRIDVYESVVSTNTLLRERAKELPGSCAAIASEQTGGRGRRGRSFFSPAGTGLYMSMLLRPGTDAERASDLTTIAAVAVCQSIEKVLGLEPWIKWVNDVYLGRRKVCGILTEAISSPGAVTVDCTIVGIGINVYEPEGGFPPEIADKAGALTKQRIPGLRARLAASVLDCFGGLYRRFLDGGDCTDEYRRRCGVIGREIIVLTPGGGYDARALDVDERCRLLTELPDGTRRTLSSGEISIKLKDK